MTSGFDQPARNLETQAPAASTPFEAHSLQAGTQASQRAPEPKVLEFGSAFKPAGDSTLVAQAAPANMVGDPAITRPSWAQTPSTDILRPADKPWERGNRDSRPTWEQAPPRRDQTPPQRDQTPPRGDQTTPPRGDQTTPPRGDQVTPPRHDSTHVRVGSDKFNLRDRVDPRVMRQIPDAFVYVNPGFDSSKPVNLIVYNHGWYDTANSAFRNARLQEQMAKAPPNSILVVPAWQANEGAASGVEDARFKTNFVGMLSAAMRANGRSLNDIGDITFVSHSAGYNAINRELNALKSTTLYDKISTVANLDSNLESTQPATEEWIAHNLRNGKFANGKATYLNVWAPGQTNGNTRGQAARIENLAAHGYGTRNNIVSIDYGQRGRPPISPEQLSRRPITFQHTNDDHGRIPIVFFGHAISRLPRSR